MLLRNSRPVTALPALQTLLESPKRGAHLALPEKLGRWYGKLSFGSRKHGPWVLGNFVSTIDGVVSLDSGKSGGGAVSGGNQPDLMLMGLLRATADAVMEGAGTLRAAPRSILTPKDAFPAFKKEFAEFRLRLGKPESPLNVIVSESGDLDLRMRIFKSSEVEVLILTGAAGAKKLARQRLPERVAVRQIPGKGKLEARALIRAVGLKGGQILLAEGGPHLFGSLLKGRQVDELFLTMAPQVAGRKAKSHRPGLVSGQTFAPEDPLWANLASVKKSGNHLFLRYLFPALQRPNQRFKKR